LWEQVGGTFDTKHCEYETKHVLSHYNIQDKNYEYIYAEQTRLRTSLGAHWEQHLIGERDAMEPSYFNPILLYNHHHSPPLPSPPLFLLILSKWNEGAK